MTRTEYVRSPFLGNPLPRPLLDLREFFIILAPVAAAVEAAAPPDPPNLPSSERDTVRLTRFAFRIIRLHKSKALIASCKDTMIRVITDDVKLPKIGTSYLELECYLWLAALAIIALLAGELPGS